MTGQLPWKDLGSKVPSGRMLQNNTASPFWGLTARPCSEVWVDIVHNVSSGAISSMGQAVGQKSREIITRASRILCAVLECSAQYSILLANALTPPALAFTSQHAMIQIQQCSHPAFTRDFSNTSPLSHLIICHNKSAIGHAPPTSSNQTKLLSASMPI